MVEATSQIGFLFSQIGYQFIKQIFKTGEEKEEIAYQKSSSPTESGGGKIIETTSKDSGHYYIANPNNTLLWWKSLKITVDLYCSGQIILFHQPRCPWNKMISLTFHHHLGEIGRVRSLIILWPDCLIPPPIWVPFNDPLKKKKSKQQKPTAQTATNCRSKDLDVVHSQVTAAVHSWPNANSWTVQKARIRC